MKKVYVGLSLIVIIVCIAKLAKADEMFVNGHFEEAICETLWSEPVQVRCISTNYICTFWAETGQHSCEKR